MDRDIFAHLLKSVTWRRYTDQPRTPPTGRTTVVRGTLAPLSDVER